MNSIARELDPGFVRRTFNFDPDTGAVTWAANGARHAAGDVVGRASDNRYGMVRIGQFRAYLHRVAWVHYYGSNPSGVIDHINGKKGDNRISNLRDVPMSRNALNVRPDKASGESGIRGVWRHSVQKDKFTSRITIDGRRVTLGIYDTEEQAAKAYQEAAERALSTPVGAAAASGLRTVRIRMHIEVDVPEGLVGSTEMDRAAFSERILLDGSAGPDDGLVIRSGRLGEDLGQVRVCRLVAMK